MYVFKVHGDAARSEGGEKFGVASNQDFVFLWLPRPVVVQSAIMESMRMRVVSPGSAWAWTV